MENSQTHEQTNLPGFEPVPEGKETVADVFEQLAGLVAEDQHVKITVYKIADNGKPQYCEEYTEQVPSLSDLRKKWGGGKYQFGIYHKEPNKRGRTYTRRIDIMEAAANYSQAMGSQGAANEQGHLATVAREAINALKESQKSFTEALERSGQGRDMLGLSKMVNGILAESASNQLSLINAMTAQQVPGLAAPQEQDEMPQHSDLKEMIVELVVDFADKIINGGSLKRKMYGRAVENSEEYQYLLDNPEEYQKVFTEISQEQPQLVPKMRAMLSALGAPDPETLIRQHQQPEFTE